MLALLIGLATWRLWPRPAELSGTLLVQQEVPLNSRETGIVRLRLPDGTPRSLVFDRPDDRFAGVGPVAVARDGSRLAFIDVAPGPIYRVYIANLDGSDARAVSAGPRDFKPVFSPDGSQIVFIRSRDYFSALFGVDLATGEERQLTDYTNNIEPDWAPDGSRIVFTTSRDGFQELYTMAPDGSDQRRLTVNEGLNDLRAAYSPDGTRIAYMTNYSVGDGSGEIWVMDADGGNQRRLTNNTVTDANPVWSPDGRYLAFTTASSAPLLGRRLMVYELEADRSYPLSEYGEIGKGAFGQTWSPDGEWIAYLEPAGGSREQLMAVRRDGTDRRLLLEPVSIMQPVWLSD